MEINKHNFINSENLNDITIKICLTVIRNKFIVILVKIRSKYISIIFYKLNLNYLGVHDERGNG